jgi:hypothetical protein
LVGGDVIGVRIHLRFHGDNRNKGRRVEDERTRKNQKNPHNVEPNSSEDASKNFTDLSITS